jgi:hypothetical protein
VSPSPRRSDVGKVCEIEISIQLLAPSKATISSVIAVRPGPEDSRSARPSECVAADAAAARPTPYVNTVLANLARHAQLVDGARRTGAHFSAAIDTAAVITAEIGAGTARTTSFSPMLSRPFRPLATPCSGTR